MPASPFQPYGLDPEDPHFAELLTGHLAADNLIPQFNMILALAWYDKGRLEHLLQELFPGRTVSICWSELPRFSDSARIKCVAHDPQTPAERLACDGHLTERPAVGGPDPGEYYLTVEFTLASFCVHWLPEVGEVTATLSVHCSPAVLEQQVAALLSAA